MLLGPTSHFTLYTYYTYYYTGRTNRSSEQKSLAGLLLMEVQAPVTMEEAVVEGAATFILLCAGMIITKIVTKFIIL